MAPRVFGSTGTFTGPRTGALAATVAGLLSAAGGAGCTEAVTQILDSPDALGSVRADAAPQGGSDSSLQDMGARPDTGPRPDSGHRPDLDADVIDVGEGPCGAGPVSISFDATVLPPNTLREQRITGRARIETWFPALTLAFDSGERVIIQGRIENTAWPEPLLLPTVQADVLIRRPFRAEVSFQLTTVFGVQPFPTMTMVGWSQSRETVDVRAGQPRYAPGACATMTRCGRAAPMHASVVAPNGAQLFALAGQRVDQDNQTLINSSESLLYIGGASCEDVPPLWISGLWVDRGF